MPFALLVALRYLRAQPFQTSLILAGIGVGVAVIVFLSALITGLQQSIIDRTLGSQAHVFIRPQEELPRIHRPDDSTLVSVEMERPPQRVLVIEGWQQILERALGTPSVTGAAPTITGPGLAERGQGSIAVSVRGIEIESYQSVIDIESRLVSGSFDLAGFNTVVGVGLAEKLGVGVGGRIRLRGAVGQSSPYTIAGIFDYESVTLNEGLVFISLRGAQTFFGLEGGGVSAIEINGEDVFEANALAREIEDRTGLVTESWMDQNGNLLVGLRSQAMSSVVIQTFVVLAVALGIASVLAVSVVQKSREIGILRATGTQARDVTRIFLIQGALLGAAGSAIGIIMGTLLSLVFVNLARNPDGSATLPIALSATLYARSVAVAMGVGLLAAVLPARDANRMDPATVIRNG